MGEIINLFDELQMRYYEVSANESSFGKVNERDMDRIEAELIRFVDELALAN